MEVSSEQQFLTPFSGGAGGNPGSGGEFWEACFCVQASKMRILDPPRNASKELLMHCGPLGGLWEALEELWEGLEEVLESFGRVWGSSGRALEGSRGALGRL